jgi:hypothetical protein
MGSFNILYCIVNCPHCGHEQEARIQFKYGNTWQFKFQMGDDIKWGGNDIGNHHIQSVMAYGIIESTLCIYCNEHNIPEEYDITIANNKIIGIRLMENIGNYIHANCEYYEISFEPND